MRTKIILPHIKNRLVQRTFTTVLLLTGILLANNVLAENSVRFTPNDHTVMDAKTGLMWQKGDSYHELKQGMTWYEALEYVDRKNREKFGGHNDWRLPSLKELQSLWDPKRPTLSKDGEAIGLSKEFQGGGSYYLWTGDERSLDNAWYFGLGQREDYFNLKETGDLDQGVKLVRNTNKS